MIAAVAVLVGGCGAETGPAQSAATGAPASAASATPAPTTPAEGECQVDPQYEMDRGYDVAVTTENEVILEGRAGATDSTDTRTLEEDVLEYPYAEVQVDVDRTLVAPSGWTAPGQTVTVRLPGGTQGCYPVGSVVQVFGDTYGDPSGDPQVIPGWVFRDDGGTLVNTMDPTEMISRAEAEQRLRDAGLAAAPSSG